MNTKKKSLHSCHGFTMMELLIVVAIIGILAAISIPNIISMKKQLEMAKLDEYAKQIYLAAQNEAVKMKASGELEKLYNDMEDSWKLEQAPVDYPNDGDTWKQLYYLSSEESVTKKYMLHANSSLSTVEDGSGYFIIELNPNPTSGDIYSVFYSEHPFTYNDITNLVSRSRAGRTGAKLGYYSGSSSNAADVLPEKFTPKVEIINNEQLIAKISCPGMLLINSTQQYLTLEVTVTDESGNPDHKWEKTYRGGTSELNVVGDRAEVTLLLDGLGSGESFSEITGSRLAPGDDITVTAKFIYDNNGISINSGDVGASAAANSLFDYRIVGSDNSATIGIGYVRHLNNLRSSKYTHPDMYQPLTIEQTQKVIDFSTVSPYLNVFEPIESPLFATGLHTPVTFDGKSNQLINFIFKSQSSSSYAGLFHELKNCQIKNIQIIDCTVNGQSGYAGSLAGFVQDCTIQNCGVYLDTSKSPVTGNRPDMEEKTARCQVTGSGSIGGLIGYCENSNLINCFSAINVSGTGTNGIGGLVGYVTSNSSIANCYSSGDVRPSAGTSGGLIGTVSGSTVTNCYTTSDLTAETSSVLDAGILLGHSSGSTIGQCSAYGFANTGKNSVRTGFTAANFGSSYVNCQYLQQAKYNDDFSSIEGVSSKGYRALKAASSNRDSSFPYEKTLVGNGFPFNLLKYASGDGEINMNHYGNWPPELKLQTSLVYYELYENGTYGFYAETSLTTGEESASDTSATANTWVLNTLADPNDPDKSDIICVEDGYAIMTPYLLSRFEYTLSTDKSTDYPDSKRPLQTINIGNESNQASKLPFSEDENLVFKTTEDGRIIEYSITGVNIFRLPFGMQMPSSDSTGKKKSSRFYTQLRVNGYIEGDTEPRFSDFIFYYCPDFAKNAINPSFGDSNASCPADPDANANKYVYVRSARQLNALGRTPYYWNSVDASNANREFYFLQETDVNFSKYTKMYCGVSIDLMNPYGAYANSPIGHTNGTDEKNFRYTYDGGGKRIVNYRLYNTANQFCGLFGEIQHATLKNIVMTTENLSEDVTDHEDAPGYIRSSYLDSASDLVPGVGGLVGLIYQGKMSDEGDNLPVATVENCSVSGYEVSYSNSSYTKRLAVGGLAGFSFGVIKNSSAINRLVSVEIRTAYDKAAVGGLLGSIEGKGTIDHCYSGGNLRFNTTTDKKANSNKMVGGLCGAGYLNIYGYGQGEGVNANTREISYSYSYCNWTLDDVRYAACYPVSPASSTKQTNCYYLDGKFNIVFSTDNQSTSQTIDELSSNSVLFDNGFGDAAPQHTFPWEEDLEHLSGRPYPFPAIVKDLNTDGSEKDFVHYGSWYGVTYTDADAAYLCYYERYSNGSYGFYYLDEEDNANRSSLDDKDAYDIEAAGYGILCPQNKLFNFYYSDAYENAPLIDAIKYNKPWIEEEFLTYAGEFGLYLYPFTKEFREECLYPKSGLGSRLVGLSYTKKDGSQMPVQNFYINAHFAADISHSPDQTGEIRTAEQLQFIHNSPSSVYGKGWTFNQTHNIIASASTGMITAQNGNGIKYNGGGHRISGLKQPLFDTLGNQTAINDLMLTNVDIHMETPNAIAPFALNNNVATITNCSVSGNISSSNASVAGFVVTNNSQSGIVNCYADINVTSANNTAAGFVITNNGNITNCGFYNTDKNSVKTVSAGGDASGFVLNDTGTIKLSLSHGSTVSAKGNASGFVSGKNSGTITGCYSNSTVSGVNAAGFAHSGTGGISQCYVVGTVNASSGTASGFTNQSWADVKNCYTAAAVTSASGTAYGFGSAPLNSGGNSTCFWVSSNKMNNGLDDGSGIATPLKSLGLLKDSNILNTLNLGGPSYPIWTLTTSAADTFSDTMPETSAYPYPRLSVLPHRGDWPVDVKKGMIGVYQIYSQKIWSDTYYYMSGSGIDLNTSKTSEYSPSYWSNTSHKFGVFFTKDMADELPYWTITVLKSKTERSYNLSELSLFKAGYDNDNISNGALFYSLPDETSGNNVDSITLTAPDSTQYIFYRTSDTLYGWTYYNFTYAP